MCDDDLEKLNTYSAPSSFDLNESFDFKPSSEDSADTSTDTSTDTTEVVEVVEEVVPVIPVDKGTCYSKEQWDRGCNLGIETDFC